MIDVALSNRDRRMPEHPSRPWVKQGRSAYFKEGRGDSDA
jgi:hypothetical protein